MVSFTHSFFFAPTPRHSLANTVFELARKLSVRVTRSTVDKQIRQHPEFPQVRSIADTLASFGIKSRAALLDPQDYSKVQFPMLARCVETDTHGNEFEALVVVGNIADEKVEFFEARQGWKTAPLSKFQNIWDGKALLVAASPQAGEDDYFRKRFLEVTSGLRGLVLTCLLLALVIALLAIGLTSGVAVITWLPMLLIKIFGMGVSFILLAQTIDKDSPIFARSCESKGQVSCADVLSSPAAKLFGWLNMSELGFLYFTGTFIALLLSLCLANQVVNVYLLWLTMAALPYTFFSVYYQKQVIRKWCKLCLYIQLAFWLEFIAGVRFWVTPEFSINSVAILLLGLLLPLTFWTAFKDNIGIKRQMDLLLDTLDRVKRNRSVIEAQLDSENIVELEPLYGDIRIGNSTAVHQAIFVTNLFCPHCKAAHREIKNLMKSAGERFQFHTRLLTPNCPLAVDQNDRLKKMKPYFEQLDKAQQKWFANWYGATEPEWQRYLDSNHSYDILCAHVAATVIQMQIEQGSEAAAKAISSWFNSYDGTINSAEKWLSNQSPRVQLDSQWLENLESINVWALTAGINSVPMVIINGQRFNQGIFNFSDLAYL